MRFEINILGYGVYLAIAWFDIMMLDRTILSWAITRRHKIWRGESHWRSENGYNYRRYKNGEVVENISFRSPIVKHVP